MLALEAINMASPYVRRLRLGMEFVALYKGRGWTSTQFAKAVGMDRTKMSRYVNAHQKPDLVEVMKILKVCEVSKPKHDEIMQIAFDAAEKGWWDSIGDSMGKRQKLFADIESGAATIREYQQTNIPGVLQTLEYTMALVEYDREESPELDYDPDQAIQARAQRQRVLFREDGPSYELILDEIVTRRLAVPATVLSAQLLHLVALAEDNKVSLRLLPVDLPVVRTPMVKSPFYLYTFTDANDPSLTLVDTVTSDLVLAEPDKVALYASRFDRLREATLSVADSRAALSKTAEQLLQKSGSTK